MDDYSFLNDETVFHLEGHVGDAIGSLFINFALLDTNLNNALCALLELNETQEHFLVKPLQPRLKIETIRSFTKHNWDKESFSGVKALCDAAEKMVIYRNNLAHGTFIQNPDAPRLLLKVFKRHQPDPKVFDLIGEDVAHNAISTVQLANGFRRLALSIAEGKLPLQAAEPQEHPE